MDVHCLKGETRGKVWSSFKFWWEKMISCNKQRECGRLKQYAVKNENVKGGI